MRLFEGMCTSLDLTHLDLKVFDGQDKSELSMIEVAHAILAYHGEAMAFADLTNEVQQYLGKSDEEIRERLSQFYTDLNVDGSFISLGDNTWGLRAWYPYESIDEATVGENEEETVTEEEIKMMIDQGKEKGTIEEEEKELLNNVFGFDDITVSEIMTHRKDIFAVDINTSAQELMQEISKEEYRYSRIPVYDETIDDIKGILYVKDILKHINKKTFKIKNIIHEPYFVPQTKMIDDLFREMQKNKTQMAIILDEYGGTAGLITMEDILEELVGEIYDEYDDEEAQYEKIDEDTYLLSGSMTIYDVNKLLDAQIPEGDYDTISGFLQDELDRIPEDEENPVIETERVTYKIEEYEDKRIVKVKAGKNRDA